MEQKYRTCHQYISANPPGDMFPPKTGAKPQSEALASRHGRDSESLDWIYGPVGMPQHVNMDRKIHLFGMLRDTIVSSQYAKKNPQISASLVCGESFPGGIQVCLTLTSLSNPDGHTNFWGMVW